VNEKIIVIPVFIPHLGCPHTCVFCNQKKIAGSYKKPTGSQVKKIVETHLNTLKDRKNSFIELAFYGGSFTGIQKELQEELLQAAWELKKSNLINGIRMSTRPDYINFEVIERLKRFEVDTIELGVQSLDLDVLTRSERGHSPLDVRNAVKRLKDAQKKVGIQLMPGLPEDTREKVLITTKEVIKLQPDFVRIYPTVVIKATKLAKWFNTGEFKPWSLEKAVEVSTEMFILFSQANITVIRMGLQATDNLQEGKDLLAGPYHPSFGELVKSRVFRKQLEYLIINKAVENLKNQLVIYCHPKEISQVKGQHQGNLKYFQDNYHMSIKVSPQSGLSLGSIAWENTKNLFCSFFSRREFLDKYRISD